MHRMDLEVVFTIANFSTTPAWLSLLFAPRWRGTERLAHSVLMPLLLGVAYALLLFTDMGDGGDASFFSLAGVMAIFDKPQTVIAAWIHYLVFDLFVGAWVARDAGKRSIPHGLIVPCLLGTWFFGPVGLGAYLSLRLAKHRALSLREPPH